MAMETMTQKIVVSLAMQRFGAAEMLRRLATAVEQSGHDVEVESIELTLRHEHLEMLEEIVIGEPVLAG